MKKILIITFTLVFGFTLYANLSNVQSFSSTTQLSFEPYLNKCLLAYSLMDEYKAMPTNTECKCDVQGNDILEGYITNCQSCTGETCNALQCTGTHSCCYPSTPKQ